MPRIRARKLLTVIAVTAVSAVMMIYGVAAFFSPLPAGAIFIVIGLLTMATVQPWQRRHIRRLRARYRWFDRLVRLSGSRGPRHVKEVVRSTDPGADANEADKSAP